MVIRYTKCGAPYRTFPYSRAEKEEMRRRNFNEPFNAIWRHRPAKRPQDQEPSELPPEGTRPERKQP
jgi:hypothetical protein